MFDALFKKYKRLVFFDTETTGLMPEGNDQIIELAAIAVDADGTEQEMDEFIRLHTMDEIPPKIVELTGITPLTLGTQGIDEHEAVRKFWSIAEPEEMDFFKNTETLLIAHNAHFDLMFLAHAQIRCRKNHGMTQEYAAFKDADYLDTLTVFRDRRRYPHKLENAIAEYGLSGKVENSHRAVDDCKALYEVAKKMEEEKADLDRYINIFGFLKKWGPEKHPFKKVTYGPQDFDNRGCKPLYERVGG